MGGASPRPDEVEQHPTIGVQKSSSPPVDFPAAKGQSEEASMALSETKLEPSSKSSPPGIVDHPFWVPAALSKPYLSR